MTSVDIEIMKQFFDKILALKDPDVNSSIKHHNIQMINDKVEIKEEKKIGKVKSKDANQTENESKLYLNMRIKSDTLQW